MLALVRDEANIQYNDWMLTIVACTNIFSHTYTQSVSLDQHKFILNPQQQFNRITVTEK